MLVSQGPLPPASMLLPDLVGLFRGQAFTDRDCRDQMPQAMDRPPLISDQREVTGGTVPHARREMRITQKIKEASSGIKVVSTRPCSLVHPEDAADSIPLPIKWQLLAENRTRKMEFF